MCKGAIGCSQVPAGLEAPAPPRPPGKVKAGCGPRWAGLHVQALRPPCGSAWSQLSKTALSEVLPRAGTRGSICVKCPCRWKAEAEPQAGREEGAQWACGFFLG